MAIQARGMLFAGLEALVERYASQQALDMDPLAVPHSYANPLDQEVAAWVAAHLAYGRVSPMLVAIRRVLAPLGPTPAAWLSSQKPDMARRQLEEALQGWVWRFHTAEDLIEWLLVWQHLNEETGGLGVAPLLERGPLDERLSSLVRRLRQALPDTPGLRFMLPDPAKGSACKRWRMFMRWMVRAEWPDLGLWTALNPSDLVIPLDTHVARFGRQFGLTQRKSMNGLMAQEITASLRSLSPEDPLRYDFALARLGILGHCPTPPSAQTCDSCPMKSVCSGTRKQGGSRR